MNRVFCLLLLFVGGFAYGGLTLAQDAGEAGGGAQPTVPVAAPAPSVEEEEAASIVGMILDSGPLGWAFMAVLGIFSLVGAAVAIERLVNLTRGKVLPPEFVGRFKELVARGEDRPEPYRQLCEEHEAPIADILKAGLLRSGRPLPEVEKSMEDAAVREMATLRSSARPLGVIGSVAPLVGLLGTVCGMIIAFFQASQEGLGKAELLAQGIYLALLTTAAGLSIAIPAMLLAAMFNGRAEKYLREIDEHLMEAMPALARMEIAGPATTPSPVVAPSAEPSPAAAAKPR